MRRRDRKTGAVKNTTINKTEYFLKVTFKLKLKLRDKNRTI